MMKNSFDRGPVGRVFADAVRFSVAFICACALLSIAGATGNPAVAQGPAYKVAVKTLRLSATKPKPGQTVTVTMTVTTTGRGRQSVPWEILVNNKRIGAGVQRNVAAGRSFNVQARWRATAGNIRFTGRVDPRNSLKEARNDLRNNRRIQSIKVAAAKPVTRPGQPRAIGAPANSRSSAPANAITVRVTSFAISPSQPKYTQQANLRFKIKVDGTGSADVDWVIKRGNAILGRGVQRNARAGQTYTVNKSWRADFGTHRFGVALDPNRKLGEPSSKRSDNVRMITVAVAPPNWAKCGSGALSGAVTAVRAWQTQAHFRNIKVAAMFATGTPGVLKGPSIAPQIKAKMISEGCPQQIAHKFADAVGDAWKQWQDRVMVPSLPWYPALGAFPGPNAPPMPNVPVPLATLPSAGAAKLSANGLKSALNAKLAAVKNQPGAAPAIQNFSAQFAARFNAWRAQQVVTNVMGGGRVPSFAPPIKPVGPVVNGRASSAPGQSLRSKPF